MHNMHAQSRNVKRIRLNTENKVSCYSEKNGYRPLRATIVHYDKIGEKINAANKNSRKTGLPHRSQAGIHVCKAFGVGGLRTPPKGGPKATPDWKG